MSKNSNPMSGRKAAILQLAEVVNKYLATPQGKALAAKLPKTLNTKPALQASRTGLTHKQTAWLSPVYIKAMDDMALAFEAFTGKRPSRGVVIRYALACAVECVTEAVKDRDTMHAEAFKLAGHADGR